MTFELKQYGFDERLIVKKPEDYSFGAWTKVPTTIYSPDGQWPLVLYEPQAEKYETFGCTIWGSENQAEMFIKKVFGFEPNFDERFTYLHSDVSVENRGANPQNAYESARHDGYINDEPLPDTFAEFIDKRYLTGTRIEAGKKWPQEYELLHEWVSDTSKENIVKLLPMSPVAISVTAWLQDSSGLFIDGGQPNTHWCVAFGYLKEFMGKKGIFLMVFDSYDHSVKTLHPDHRIAVAKRIHISRKEITEEEIGYIAQLLEALKNLITLLKEKLSPPTPPPVNEPVIPKEALLNGMCLAIKEMEGYFPPSPKYPEGSKSWRNKNPGNTKFSTKGYLAKYEPVRKDSTGFAIFPSYEIGWLYLKNLVLQKAKEHPNWDLLDFCSNWAPASDNNNPVAYAEFVAKKMNVPTTWKIRTLL